VAPAASSGDVMSDRSDSANAMMDMMGSSVPRQVRMGEIRVIYM